jgi:transposase
MDQSVGRFTKDESEYIQAHIDKESNKEIAARLGRSYMSVARKVASIRKSDGSGARRYWTPEEVQYLQKRFATMSIADIAKRIGHGVYGTVAKARELGLIDANYKVTDSSRKYRLWTKEDETIVREMYGRHSVTEIAKKLNRSATYVINRMQTMELVDNRFDDEVYDD